jgi:hypothetical protein
MPLDNKTPEVRNNPMPVENQLDPNTKAPGNDKKTVIAAHDEALKDIEEDPDLTSKPTPEHDLDEGEIARFEDNDTGPDIKNDEDSVV